MPGDTVYVIGTLQINPEHDKDLNTDDALIIKAKRSTLFRPAFYDILFISNKSEWVLLNAFRNSIRRGWLQVLVLIALPAWLSINAWTNLSIAMAGDIQAAPAVFRMITPATEWQRQRR